MDIDVVQPTRNSPFINFFDVSNNFPWQEPRPEQIRERRAAMSDGLLFDVLLMSGGIAEPYLIYPPEDAQGLQTLLDAIESSGYDTLKKDCLVYFLLKWHQDGRERTFQQQRCIAPQFAALSDAYWHLDTGINVPRAVAILSDARLNRDYASKIIHAISISPDSAPLIRRYVQTAKPLLIEPLDIECYTLALAEASIRDAWQFSRTFNETDSMRTRVLKKIIEWTVSPNPRSVALSQLIALPLSTFEENVFNLFVQKPPPSLKFSAVATLQDLICVRLIQGGRYSEAIKLDRQFSSTTLSKNIQLTKDRSKMVHDIYTALPSIERSLIDLELDPTTAQKPLLVSKPLSPMRKPAPAPPQAEEPGNMPLSQSWEDVRMPDVTTTTQATPLRDVRVPSTTPRFGGPSSLQGSTSTPAGTPIIPINFNGVASGSKATPRKSLPLSASVLGLATKPRSQLSGVGSRMSLGGGGLTIASPASGMGVPQAPANVPSMTFVSAGQKPNAFYKPPPQKTNGTKRAFEETMQSPERADVSAHTMDVDMEAEGGDDIFEREKEKERQQVDEEQEEEEERERAKQTPQSKTRRGRISGATEEIDEDESNVFQHSVFRKSVEQESSPLRSVLTKSTNKAPPGSFAPPSEDEYEMNEEQEVAKPRKTTRGRTSGKGAAAQQQQETPQVTSSKRPAKKARPSKETMSLSRSIPGSFGDELENDHDQQEEEQGDHVAPLPPRRGGARKLRASMSVESTADEGEGVKTRRRSSRLTTNGSVHEGSPEPAPAPKPKKTARTTKKKKV